MPSFVLLKQNTTVLRCFSKSTIRNNITLCEQHLLETLYMSPVQSYVFVFKYQLNVII